MNTNTLTFKVTLTFSDPIDPQNISEVVANIQDGLNAQRDVQLAPEGGDAVTDDIQVEVMSIQAAKDVLAENGYLQIFWTEDDIRGYELYDNEGNEIPPLTDDEVAEIANSIEENFDASIGVSWDTIASEINEALDNRKNTEA